MTDYIPEWIVEIDWLGDGTWTDMSTIVVGDEELGRIRSLDYKRGKNDDLGRYERGTATIVFDNRDRALEPNYQGSPHWPYVTTSKRIRILAGWDALAGPVWTGKISSIDPEWERSAADAAVTVGAVDRLEDLVGIRLPASVHIATVTAAAPDAWWRQGEESGIAVADSSGNGHHGTYENGAVFNSRTGLVAFDSDHAIEYPAGHVFNYQNSGPYAVVPPVVTAYPFTIRAAVKTTAEHNAAARMLWNAMGVDGEYIELGVLADDWTPFGTEAAGNVIATISSGGVLRARVATGISVNDGENHDIEWVVANASTWTLRVDGITRSQYSFASGAPAFPALTRATIGASARTTFYADAETGAFDGIIDEVMMFARSVDTATLDELVEARTTPWEGDLPGERIAKILALAGIDAADYNLDPGKALLQATGLGGAPLEHIRPVEEAETGEFFVLADGTFRFRDRDAPYDEPRSNTVQAVFGDDWEDGDEIPYTDVEPTMSVDTVINSAAYTRSGGATFLVEDAASIGPPGNHGYRSDEKTLAVLDDNDVVDAAGIVVATFAEPFLRFRSISLKPAIDPDNLWPVVLELDIGDRVAFRKRPPGDGDPVDVDAIIVGVDGDAPAGESTVRYVLGPPPPDPLAWADDVDGTGPGLGWSGDTAGEQGIWVR